MGKQYLSHAMILSTRNDWRRQRKLISKAFDFESMRKLLPILEEVAKEHLENQTFTNGKEPQELQTIFRHFSWEIISRCFFGVVLSSYTVNGEPFVDELNRVIKEQFDVFLSSSSRTQKLVKILCQTRN